MRWWDSIRQAAGRGRAAARGLSGGAAEFFRKYRKPALIGLAACGAFLVLCVSAVLVITRNNAGDAGTGDAGDLSGAFGPHSVPAEEFFLPGEPDFLPETIPERERRAAWTGEDAEPFWTDPAGPDAADLGEYTDLMSAVIDDLMERVP
jgi:hypothetical protein